MKIYRLEHPAYNRGPHTAVNFDVNTAAAWELAGEEPGMPTPNRPSPIRDFPFGWDWVDELRHKFGCNLNQIYFGCKSYEDLQKWFSGELFELLLHAGHEVKIYNVPDTQAYAGNKQVAFVKP